MAANCPTCNQPMPDEKGRTYVSIPSPEAFRNLCNLLLTSPNCTDEKFKLALKDLPQALARYNQLTTGQWKFFCVIHKNILGTWPSRPEDLVESKQDDSPLPDLEEIPF